MQRILVTGNAGSGKTTLASLLALRLELPYVGLDSIVWQPGWQKTPHAERSRRESAVAEGDVWVVDGVSDAILNAADTVVFLDLPRSRCYWRAFKRNLPFLFKSRPGLPDSCPEIQILPSLVRIIWRFPKHVRPRILKRCTEGGKRFVHIRSDRDLVAFIASLSY